MDRVKEKKTMEISVAEVSKITHLYIIRYAITLAGKLLPKFSYIYKKQMASLDREFEQK